MPRGRIGAGGRSRPPRHRVDREVPAREVRLERGPELDPVGAPKVGVVVVAPERRDLILVTPPPDRDGPEPVLVHGVREELLRLLGQRVGREIPVLRRPAQQGVAK